MCTFHILTLCLISYLVILGVLGSPKTCLHAVLSLVQLEPNSATFIGCHLSQPRVAELCYKLLYCLCASRELSQATLRYLRNNHDFFHTQLAALPFPSALTDDDEEGEKEIIGNVALLNQQAWILQAVALELRMTALNNQRSHVQRLTRLLLHSSPLLGHTLPDLTITTNQSINWPTSDTTYNQFDDGRLKLLILLDLVQFIDIPYPPLKLVYFDQARVEQVIASCEEKSADDGVPYVDVKVLHRLLMNEVNTLQGPAVIGQKPNIVKVHAVVVLYMCIVLLSLTYSLRLFVRKFMTFLVLWWKGTVSVRRITANSTSWSHGVNWWRSL